MSLVVGFAGSSAFTIRKTVEAVVLGLADAEGKTAKVVPMQMVSKAQKDSLGIHGYTHASSNGSEQDERARTEPLSKRC